jgi:hypothetical protein
MKKFILALMVVTTLISCGKDNKVSSGPVAGSEPLTGTAANDTSAVGLAALVDNYSTSFGLGQVFINNNNYTWNQVVTNSPNVNYKYGSYAASSAQSNCDKKWGIFYVCSSSSTSRSTPASVSRTVINSSVDITAKKIELKSIISRVSPYYPVQTSGYIYYIRTVEGVLYTFDVRLPIQANPSAVQQANGQTEYFLGGAF